jgi:DNA-binding transcriptional ArsR family regulator
MRIADAAAALDRAHAAARTARIPALIAEIDRARRALSAPAARLIRAGEIRVLRLDEVEALLASGNLIVVRALAEAWPADVPRDQLIARTFATRVGNESHRARLRVETGRLRAVLRPLARIEATPRGFVIAPLEARNAAVLAPPIDGPVGSILALLEDGESWSTSALACALGSSQRTVQRTLRQLVEAGAVRSVGHGRSRRWLASALNGFATTLLLPLSLQIG